jgi:hypothetical protein
VGPLRGGVDGTFTTPPQAPTAPDALQQKNPRDQEGAAGCLMGKSCY